MFNALSSMDPGLLVTVICFTLAVILLTIFWVRAKRATRQQASRPQPQPAPAPQPAAQAPAQSRIQAPPIQPAASRAASADDQAGPPPGGPLPGAAEMARMPLSKLVKVLGLEHVMRVDDTFGVTADRVALLVAWICLSAYLLLNIGPWAVSFISDNSAAGYLLGAGLWVVAMGMSLGYFLVYVREDVAFIGVDAVTGVQHVFKTGVNAKYPTESVHKRNFIDLTLGEINETQTYNTQDGGRYTYTYLILYRPSVKRLPIYRAVKEEDIVREVQAIARSALSLIIINKKASELNNKLGAAAIEDDMRKALGQLSDAGHELEYRFGIDIINISLSEPTPSKELVEGRQAVIVADMLRQAVDKLRGTDKELSAQEANNIALMLNKESVTKTVHAFELGNVSAVAEGIADRLITAFKK